jgi:hypothetical protein
MMNADISAVPPKPVPAGVTGFAWMAADIFFPIRPRVFNRKVRTVLHALSIQQRFGGRMRSGVAGN